MREIGKNMFALEYGNDMIIIDCGIAFPDEEMPGIDVVIPDFTYVRENAHKLRGVFLTHGHEDHIGAIP
ncbi:MAG: MBL fold metallo-hydrolase, partial [Ruminococcaceae bacterium]|nr:MBL fold metallo-hydrolase [Oscillospiraceae bacterium]